MHCSCWHGGGTTAAIGGAEAAHNGAQQAGMELQAGRKGLAWCAWGLRGTAASLGLPQRPTPHSPVPPPPLPGNRAHGLQQRWEESCFPEEDRTGAMKLAAALCSHLSIPVGSQHTVPAQPSASPTHSSMQTHSCVLKESSMHCVLLFRSLTPKAGPEHPSSRNYQRPLC